MYKYRKYSGKPIKRESPLLSNEAFSVIIIEKMMQNVFNSMLYHQLFEDENSHRLVFLYLLCRVLLY